MNRSEGFDLVRQFLTVIAWFCVVGASLIAALVFLSPPLRDFGHSHALGELLVLRTVPLLIGLSVVCQWLARWPTSKRGRIIYRTLLALCLLRVMSAVYAVSTPGKGMLQALGF